MQQQTFCSNILSHNKSRKTQTYDTEIDRFLQWGGPNFPFPSLEMGRAWSSNAFWL